MFALLRFFLALFSSLFKSKSRLEAENAALRRQLIVLQRKVRGRVHFTNSDRLFLIQLYRWFPLLDHLNSDGFDCRSDRLFPRVGIAAAKGRPAKRKRYWPAFRDALMREHPTFALRLARSSVRPPRSSSYASGN